MLVAEVPRITAHLQSRRYFGLCGSTPGRAGNLSPEYRRGSRRSGRPSSAGIQPASIRRLVIRAPFQRNRVLRRSAGSIDIDSVTDHPEFELFEALLPAGLESLHPFPITRRVGDVDDDSRQIVPIQNTA